MAVKISCVLAVYNGERHLESSVRSILAQSCRDFELIVVDDGSTDRTAEILAQLARSDARIVVVAQPNQGLTASLNAGVAVATGAYIARQDADDLSSPERFARQAAHLEAHPALAALGTGADVIDHAGSIVGALTVPTGAEAVTRGLWTLRATPVHGSMMVRRTALDAAGGYRPAFWYGQDYDLWLRLSSRFVIDNLPEVLYQWRLDAGGVYATKRTTQVKYAGVALAFARERAQGVADSYESLAGCHGDLDRFADHYRSAAFVHATWAELLLRGLGNSATVRWYFRRALLGGWLRPRTVLLAVWTHLGLPWPGGRPLAAPGRTEGLA